MGRFAACLGLWAAMIGGTRAAERAPGAVVPFITREAEDAGNRTNGTVVKLTKLPGPTEMTPELEASGRAYVELSRTEDYLEYPRVPAANAMVIRHCIPDAPGGGGLAATLGLYVNGRRRQDVTLTSKHNWLYGTGKMGENGQSNTPTDFPHVFWDEARLFIEGGVKAGDTIRLQKDASDTAAFYRMDLVELESVPAPLPRPANSLSVADYGARGDDEAPDTAATKKCIRDAKAQRKIVWIPPGDYLQDDHFDLEGVRVQGAGMWYTNLHDTVGNRATTHAANAGFRLLGSGPGVSDLYIDSPACTSRSRTGPKGFTGVADNWSIKNVWMTHLNCGTWMAGTDGVVSGCRVRSTYADGININNGKTLVARRVLVENNHVRGTGDDGLAILSHEQSPNLSEEVTLRHNTVVAAWWGANCDLAGGRGHVVEDNLFADAGKSGFTINLPGAYPMNPATECVVRRNLIVRCGGNYVGQRRGAIWVYPGSTTISSTVIEDNRIIAPLFRGIHVVGTRSQHIVFKGNVIDHPGEDGIVIGGETLGSGEFTGNTVRNLNPGGRAFVKAPGGGYQVTQADNSWQ